MANNEIGRVIGVHGFHVRVELDATHKSPVRADLDGVETQIKINAFLTFEIGAGESVLGVVTDLDSREVFEPTDQQLTLELVRPRRIASVQLLGTISSKRDAASFLFDPGVNVLPTLDTPAIPARREILAAVLTDAPKRNRPPDGVQPDAEFDGKLLIGQATAAADRQVFGSFNDLFSRPLAIVGNTGSGKSCSIAHIIQEATRTCINDSATKVRPHFFVLDINGEYAKAFRIKLPTGGKQSNRLYVNGNEFGVPIWLFNAYEVCVWLNAAEQTQQPALINLWALAKGVTTLRTSGYSAIHQTSALLMSMNNLHGDPAGRKKGWGCKECWTAVKQYAQWILTDSATAAHAKTIDKILSSVPNGDSWNLDRSFGADDKAFHDSMLAIGDVVEKKLSESPLAIEQTADKPIHFALAKLGNPAALEVAAEISPGDRTIRQFLQGLQLRIQNRLTDKRWHCFYNFDNADTKIASAADWFTKLGIGGQQESPITVIDMSMISHEALPYVCGVIGRMLLELREHVAADQRFQEPWVVVLEEAHNYIRPARQDEHRGIKVSRETFERIAKEGRKFGLSLIVASQRPSEISQTVLSQCANFISHRLQNPDDIDHFRQIVPSQTRKLIDQITILRSGEAIVLGSGFFVPSRVQVELPDPAPSSQSSTPFLSWKNPAEEFAVRASLANWVGDADEKTELQPATTPKRSTSTPKSASRRT